MTNVLVLAANETHDLRDRGYPVCLTEVHGRTLVQHLIEQCLALENPRIVLAMQEEDCKRWHLDDVVKQLSPHARVMQIHRPTAGAACTALLAIAQLNNDEPLLILNGNEYIDINFADPIRCFEEADLDCGVVSFDSVHPRYSYVRLHDDRVVEVAEKRPISHHATVGFYWFKRGRDFVNSAERSILKGSHVDGVYYISPTLNELILDRAKVGIYKIDAQLFHPIKTERQMDRFDGHLKNMGQ